MGPLFEYPMGWKIREYERGTREVAIAEGKKPLTIRGSGGAS